MYSAVFKKLVEVLLRKIMYPSDNAWETWTEDNRSEFESYRKEVGFTERAADSNKLIISYRHILGQ